MSAVRIARILTVAMLVAWIASAGDPKPVPPHQREAAKPPSKTAPAKSALAVSDSQLEAAIRAKFAKSKIDADHFQVHVQGGVATIEGRTDVIQHKGVATRMAKTAGAVAVNNRVQTSEAAKQKAAANLEKGRRRAQVKRGESRSDPTLPRQAR